jgi:hypothetical protein
MPSIMGASRSPGLRLARRNVRRGSAQTKSWPSGPVSPGPDGGNVAAQKHLASEPRPLPPAPVLHIAASYMPALKPDGGVIAQRSAMAIM